LLEATGLTGLLRSRGALAIYDTEAAFEQERWIYDLEAELGFVYRRLDTAEVASLAPDLHLPGGVALMLPSWQHTLNPGALTAGIAQAAFSAGAHWRSAAVTGVEAGPEGITARLEGGTAVQADILVLAAGAWSNRLAAQLDCAVPMTAKRGYHSMIAHPGVELGLPVISGSRSFVMTPLADGLRLAGTAEFARLDAEADYRRAAVLVRHAQDYLPGLQIDGVTEWMGQRPMMSDSVPVISASPRHSNVFYAFGHGHYGLTQGATTGRLIADLVAGRDPGLDMAPYRIDRFQ
jgi:D-amino-acid dehydrogenase